MYNQTHRFIGFINEGGKKRSLQDFIFQIVLILFSLLLSGCSSPFENVSRHVSIIKGDVNGVQIRNNNQNIIVYGDPSGQVKQADYVLFTHHRRELISAGRKLADNGAKAVMPAREAGYLENPDRFWETFLERHQSYSVGMMTNRAVRSMEVSEKVRAGDEISWQGSDIKVLETPGYAENAVSYTINIDGKKYAFVGDLIYDKGQISDVYSLQSAIDSTAIKKYHGYCGRIGELIRSLQKIMAEDPDIIIPFRGNIIYEPEKAVNSLIERLHKLYKNYLAISSIRWYFEEDLNTLTEDVQISISEVDTGFFAEKLMADPPSWIVPFPVGRLMISKDGSGFLIDCGNDEIIKNIEQMIREGKLKELEGVFITHYHGDHVNRINELVDRFGCKVYANEELQEILEHPDNFSMPYRGVNPIQGINYVKDRETMRWHEFKMKFYYFPGQTIHHGAVWVDNKRDDIDIFFIGDAFSPTGIDDYCLLNRNLLHPEKGYFKCLQILKEMNTKNSPYFMINQHIHSPFWFGNDQIDNLLSNLNRRRELFRDLFPWKNLNFGIDPGWARLYPYHMEKSPGEEFNIRLRVLNHSENPERFNLNLSLPEGFDLKSGGNSISVEPFQERELNLTLNTEEDIQPGLYVMPTTVQNTKGNLSMNTECCIEIVQ